MMENRIQFPGPLADLGKGPKIKKRRRMYGLWPSRICHGKYGYGEKNFQHNKSTYAKIGHEIEKSFMFGCSNTENSLLKKTYKAQLKIPTKGD